MLPFMTEEKVQTISLIVRNALFLFFFLSKLLFAVLFKTHLRSFSFDSFDSLDCQFLHTQTCSIRHHLSPAPSVSPSGVRSKLFDIYFNFILVPLTISSLRGLRTSTSRREKENLRVREKGRQCC